ncbi:hypothetical protein D3C73_1529650 [compost metagenome]
MYTLQAVVDRRNIGPLGKKDHRHLVIDQLLPFVIDLFTVFSVIGFAAHTFTDQLFTAL